MVTAIIEEPGIAPAGLADAFATLAEQLRRSTVVVRSGGPGGGSGVIWDTDGTIITNAHVARGPRAEVQLSDGRVFQGDVTLKEERRDLAAIRLDGAADLPVAAVGNSDTLRVGQLVLAVGNPLGVVGAVTSGIIHAITTQDEGPRRQRWVQADVRLAPGNSGGPLADAAGNVIGINSMIAGGLALAVPSNAVARFLQARASRPVLGVTTQPVLVPVRGGRIFGLLVLDVARGGAAEAAGFLTGDVLIGQEGTAFARPESLIDALYDAAPGTPFRLEIIRAGQRRTLPVALAPASVDEARAA